MLAYVRGAEVLVLSAVNLGDDALALQQIGGLLILGDELLAVTAP